MQHFTRTRLLASALVVSAVALAATVTHSRLAQLASTPPTISDGQPGFSAPGFTSTKVNTAHAGYTSWVQLPPKSGNGIATWTFTQLAGGTYDAYATWYPTPAFTKAALYKAQSGTSNAQKTVDQSKGPSPSAYGEWEKIGSISVAANGTATVTVQNSVNCTSATIPKCFVQADAVMLVATGTAAGTNAGTSAGTPTCGNGTVNPGEECDDGNQSNTDNCTNACKNPVCGDGFGWATMEQCDDGNQSNADGCLNTCKPAGCGDGFVRAGIEECDYNQYPQTVSCHTNCKISVCGNRVVEGMEYCDDGNTASGDGCSAQCATEAPAGADVQSLASIELSCEGLVPYATVKYAKNHANCVSLKKTDGTFANAIQFFCDGTSLSTVVTKRVDMRQGLTLASGDKVKLCHPMVMQPWGCTGEVTVTGSGCNEAPVCGNGVKQTGEECDDGNQSNADGCLNTCKPATCGDGFHRVGYEGCDDGNRDDTDLCSYTCVPQRCGDGVAQGNRGENCDDANQNNGDACTNACKTAVCGDGHVKIGVEFCDDGNTTGGDGCSATCHTETTHVCGNGVRTGSEQCDDGNLTNGDGCSSTCQTQTTVTTGTSTCGNGVVNAGEVCDQGADNGPSPLQCSTLCRWNATNVCGNGLREGIEQCDDGNTLDTDSCTKYCRTGGICGNAVLDPGEECDDGALTDTDACTAQCKNARCGDTRVHVGVEQCDDGNTANGDGCSSTCQVQAWTGGTGTQSGTCGDWRFDAGEQCEGFAGVRTPLPNNASMCCTTSCRVEACGGTTTAPRCGDGTVNLASEQCDDGNQVDTDSCRNTCTNNTTTAPRCGDGTVNQASEQCDDGNQVANDACSNSCTTVTASSPAVLTLRHVDLGQTRRAVSNQTIVAYRFTMSATQDVVVRNLQFKPQQGSVTNGFDSFVLRKDTDGDGTGDEAVATGTIPNNATNGAIVRFTSPLPVPANATVTYDLVAEVGPYAYSYIHGFMMPAGPQQPLQLGFDTASTIYVRATYGTATTQLANIATNGACATSPCAIAVFTGTPVIHTFKKAANLTVIGQAAVPAATMLAGGESDAIMNLTARVTDDEHVLLDQLSFAVRGAQAVERLEIYVNDAHVGSASPDQCASLQFVPNAPLQHGLFNFDTKYCAIFGDRPVLRRATDNRIEIRASIKEASEDWEPGTKVRLTLLTLPDGYLKATGDTSGVWLTQPAQTTDGGNVAISGTLSTNEHTAE